MNTLTLSPSNLSLALTDINTRAHHLVKRNAITWSEAFGAAARAAAMRRKLEAGVVEFAYLKADGTVRLASGTRKMDLIPSGDLPKGNGNKPAPNVVHYYDMDACGWRCFDITRLK